MRLEPLPPEANGLAVDVIVGSDNDFGLARGEARNDPAAECHLLWCAQGGQPVLNLLLLILGQTSGWETRGITDYGPSPMPLRQ